jgi:hypothetical protein
MRNSVLEGEVTVVDGVRKDVGEQRIVRAALWIDATAWSQPVRMRRQVMVVETMRASRVRK